MSQLCGGIGPVHKSTREIQEICNQVKKQAETKTGENFGMFVAVSYTSQVVAGTNYFIKVHVGGTEYIHLRVFKPLPHTGQHLLLSAVQTAKTQNDPISFF